MTIVEFLELTAGEWFTHRTSHYVDSNEQNGQKSNLSIKLVELSNPDVQQLCQAHQLAGQIYAAQISAEGLSEPKSKLRSGATLLLFVPDPDHPETGSVYRKDVQAGATNPGRYDLNAEECLTLTISGEDIQVEELLWYESPNVRLRHSVIQQKGAASIISFASEIRRVSSPPPQ